MKCDICEQEIIVKVDHCPDTGFVRGAICADCKKGLKYLKNIENLKKAIVYMENFEMRLCEKAAKCL